MAESRNRAFAKLAKDVTATGNIKAEGISSDVTLGGATIYATRSALPVSGNTAGDQAYVTGNNRLYIWNGSGWYNVALLNLAPSITSVQDSDGNTTPFTLATDGTVTTITITATDSDGDPITFSSTADSDFAGLATISQDSSVFTITPFSSDSATTTSGTITFTASDGINLGTSGVQTFTLSFVSALWDETVLSIGTNSTNSLGNSTFVDRSTNAHTVTPSGSPVQTVFHPYLDNWSVDFDGNDYLTFADQSDWDFVNSGDFTVDSWIYPRSNSNISWFGQSGGGGGRSDKWGIYINDTSVGLSAGTIGWHLGNNGNIQGPSFTPTANTWYHIRLGREGDVWYFFVDGVLLGTTTSTIRPTPVAQTLRVGADGEAYRVFNGYLSNFRIVKGTNLSTTTFDAVTENLTAVTNTVLLTCQSNRVVDNSTNNYSATFVGDPKVSAYNPFGQESEYAVGENKGSTVFSSTSDYLECGSDASFAFGTGDYTVEFWYYSNPTNGGAIWGTVFDTTTAAAYIGGLFITASPTDGQTLQVYHNGAPSVSGTTSGKNLEPGEWTHCAVTRSGSNINIWINGVLDGTNASGGGEDLTLDEATVGRATYWGTSYSLHGGDIVSDLRVTKGTALYTSAFTPPTEPVGNTNASLYLPMDNAGIFDKTGNNTLTLAGNASTSTTQTKFADTAIYFDGSGDYLKTATDALFNLHSTDFTIEGWFYATAPAGNEHIWSSYIDTNNRESLYFSNSTTLNWWVNGSTRISATVSANQWYHFAIVNNSGTTEFYLDGVSQGTWASTYTDGSRLVWIGTYNNAAVASDSFTGYVENLQILKGVAKYTTNFTPPAQEQGRSYQAES